MPRTEYSSAVLQLANDASYSAQGDAYDATPTKTTPALAVVTQGARPARQMAARVRNWVDNQIAAVLGALIADMASTDHTHNGCRLSLSSSLSVPTADVIGGSTLYLRPHASNVIHLYDSTLGTWFPRTVSNTTGSVSLALTGMTAGRVYDVFAYWTGTAVALFMSTASFWVDDVTPNPVSYFEGVEVRALDTSSTPYRYVGSIRATAATTTEDSGAKRFVYNEDNQVRRHLYFQAPAAYFYTAAPLRQANAQTGASSYRVEVLTRRPLPIDLRLAVTFQAVTAAIFYYPAIGIDSTTVSSSALLYSSCATSAYATAEATFSGVLGPGYHAANWLESTSAGGGTAYVDFGTSKSGLRGSVTI